MTLGIIILVTRPHSLRQCLQRLIRQTYDHKKIEIFLVRSENCALELPPTDIRITEVITNDLHLCVRRNMGVNRTNADLIAFLDDDTLPPENWAAHAVAAIQQHQIDGACGPITHFDRTKPLSHRLAGAATDSVFLEGFEDTFADKPRPIKFYNIPGCNCVIKRTVWKSVGGFNENMYAYMDDIEFFYLATQCGFSFFMLPELKVQHDVPPFPFDYLRKKMITRFHTGIDTVLFHELHGQMPYIRLAIACLAGLLLLPALGNSSFLILEISASLYFAIAVGFSLKFLKTDPLICLLLPFVFLSTHSVNFLSFAAGLLYAFMRKSRYQAVIAFKNDRLQKCLN